MKIQKHKRNIRTPIIVSISMVVLIGGGYLVFAFFHGDMWPFKAQDSTVITPDLPKIEKNKTDTQSSEKTGQEATQDNPESSPTKTENKTPVQYDGEQLDDTAPYNNEQFRIPEDSSGQ